MKVIGIVFKLLAGMMLCLSVIIVIAIMLFLLKIILDELFEGDAFTEILEWCHDKKDIHTEERADTDA